MQDRPPIPVLPTKGSARKRNGNRSPIADRNTLDVATTAPGSHQLLRVLAS